MTRDTNLMQLFFLLLEITLHVSGIYIYTNLHQCTRLHTGSSETQSQHLVLNTLCSSIKRIQPNTPEDGHIDAGNM